MIHFSNKWLKQVRKNIVEKSIKFFRHLSVGCWPGSAVEMRCRIHPVCSDQLNIVCNGQQVSLTLTLGGHGDFLDWQQGTEVHSAGLCVSPPEIGLREQAVSEGRLKPKLKEHYTYHILYTKPATIVCNTNNTE